MKGHFATVKILLTIERISINIKDEDGWTALHYACLYGCFKSVRALLGRRDIDFTYFVPGTNLSALDVACYSKNFYCVNEFFISDTVKEIMRRDIRVKQLLFNTVHAALSKVDDILDTEIGKVLIGFIYDNQDFA